jgi:hypothetical protein
VGGNHAVEGAGGPGDVGLWEQDGVEDGGWAKKSARELTPPFHHRHHHRIVYFPHKLSTSCVSVPIRQILLTPKPPPPPTQHR